MLSVEESRQLTVCSLCGKTFRDPRTLPCLHTFCLQCLQNRDRDLSLFSASSACCPVCGDAFEVPSTDLPKNTFLQKLIRIHKIANVSVSERMPCDVCQGAASTLVAAAKHYCLNCDENLCDACCATHSRIKSTRQHRVIQLGQELSAQDFQGPIALCDQHVDEPLKMFCSDCTRCICFLCYAEYHTGHHCQV